jgi:hypothetical protein
MGYVSRGNVGFHSGRHREPFEAGDACYVGPGAHDQPGVARRRMVG